MAQADLDTEVLRIRDYRTRIYFADALRAYRSGAFRAAIASVWVALVYDLLRKYRELASAGDKEAAAFLKDWDAAVQNNGTAKLLELERGILDHAHAKLGLINVIGLKTLKRVFEDRHLCAHPAFQSNDELYEPTDELVKTHLCAAIDLVLAQKPLQGRGILEAFSADVVSPGFPSARPAVIDYVEQKYLAHMRESVVRNFGIVLGKSLIHGNPVEWQAHRHRVLYALVSIKMRKPNDWESVATELLRLIDDDVPANRVRCALVLSSFPEFLAKLSQSTRTALDATLGATDEVIAQPEVFHAASVAGFGDALIKRFAALDDTEAASVLAAAAPLPLWENALDRYKKSGSFRGAEFRFEQFIVPFQNVVGAAELDQLLEVVAGNGQIWDASGTSGLLEKFLRGVSPIRPSDAALDGFYASLSKTWGRQRYEEAWLLMEAQGWKRPDLPEEQQE